MEKFEFTEHSHRKYMPLTGDWILVSPQGYPQRDITAKQAAQQLNALSKQHYKVK